MKRINLIIDAVLGAAVIALFVLYFTGNKPSAAGNGNAESAASGDLKIAYFQIDSVLANWTLYTNMQDELASKQQKMESDFNGKTQNFYSSVQDAQYKVQRGLVTRAEAEKLQSQLQEEEQKLANLQQTYIQQLQEEGVVKNRQMLDKIESYLTKYNEDKGYSYIFSYTFGGNLMYADKVHDITGEIIKGINEEYKPEDQK